MCPTKDDWDSNNRGNYKFYCIGGNHSACARADLVLETPQNKSLRRIQAYVLAGLTDQEARKLAWCHNLDSEFRQPMTAIQRVTFVHTRFVENNCVSNFQFKKDCAIEINLKDIGVKKDSEVINGHDNMYQLAFRTGNVWALIAKIFEKWENVQVKGQIDKTLKKKPSKNTSGDATMPYDDMKLTEWRHMQGISNEEVVCQVLQRVVEGKLSLQEMGQEFKRHKVMNVIQRAFLYSLEETKWSDCKEKYPNHCSDKFLKDFIPIFQGFVSILTSPSLNLFFLL
jgi:hypothetical protein